MSKFDEVLAQITPEDNISEDFLTGIKTAYDEDMAEIATTHDAAIGEITATHATEIETLNTAHASEVERVRSEKFEKLLDGDDDDAPILPESYGDNADELTFENYWEVAENA